MKYQVGDKLAPRVIESVRGTMLKLPNPDVRFIHLQFRRWEGCPICNTHMASLRRSADRIKAAGIQEIIYFHSTREAIAKFQEDMPFDFVADPKKTVYRQFGVRASLKFILSFAVLWTFITGVASGRFNLNMRNGPHGLPADFLIGPDGTIVALKYGENAYDQWSVDELLAHAGSPARSGVRQVAMAYSS